MVQLVGDSKLNLGDAFISIVNAGSAGTARRKVLHHSTGEISSGSATTSSAPPSTSVTSVSLVYETLAGPYEQESPLNTKRSILQIKTGDTLHKYVIAGSHRETVHAFLKRVVQTCSNLKDKVFVEYLGLERRQISSQMRSWRFKFFLPGKDVETRKRIHKKLSGHVLQRQFYRTLLSIVLTDYVACLTLGTSRSHTQISPIISCYVIMFTFQMIPTHFLYLHSYSRRNE